MGMAGSGCCRQKGNLFRTPDCSHASKAHELGTPTEKRGQRESRAQPTQREQRHSMCLGHLQHFCALFLCTIYFCALFIFVHYLFLCAISFSALFVFALYLFLCTIFVHYFCALFIFVHSLLLCNMLCAMFRVFSRFAHTYSRKPPCFFTRTPD